MREDILAVLKDEQIDMEQCFGRLPEALRRHSRRVAEQTVILLKLALDKGIFEEDREDFSLVHAKQAALYHDIGQTLIPEGILQKRQSLTDAENQIYRQHTLFGAKLIERYRRQQTLSAEEDALWKLAAEVALSHHERWDGKGYPYGTNTNAIPLAARAAAIADTYDSYVYGTSCRMPLPAEFALLELLDGAGKKFDPRLVKLFNCHHDILK